MLTDDTLLAQLDARDIKTLCIAYSGGMDSHVLLHRFATSSLLRKKYSIIAIHVNHGLQAQSAAWAQHCQAVCQQYPVLYQQIDLHCQVPKGASVQAYAREARYNALMAALPKQSCLLTAHHQDDQAETVLLQLLRGAGVRGLAGMATWQPYGDKLLWRPFLQTVRREMIAEYAKQHQLRWIEDPSNAKTHYHRNYLRHHVFPILQQQWPSLANTFTRSARLCAQADSLLKELAHDDLRQCLQHDNGLQLTALKQLSELRQTNTLRHWLDQQGVLMPSEIQLQQIIQQFCYSADDRQPIVVLSDQQLRRYRDALYLVTPIMPQRWHEKIWDDVTQPLALPAPLGQLQASEAIGKGVCINSEDRVTVRFRQGGERCSPVGRQGSHPLKKLMQEWHIPPWQRDNIPLIYINGQLAQVVGYCLCEGFAAKHVQKGHVILNTITEPRLKSVQNPD